MAITRFGHLDDFTQKNNKVGIGTSTPQEKMEVIGGTRSTDLRVAGIATLTSAGGFVEKHIQYVEDQVIIDTGDSGTLSGEIVVGSGQTITVGTAATTSQGTVDALKVYDMFQPPSGTTNQRPPAKTGALFYNFDFKTIEFFDGNSWRQVDNIARRGRAVFGGGYTPTYTTSMETFDIHTLGNSTIFGDLDHGGAGKGTMGSNGARGLFMGGFWPSGASTTDQIDYITIAAGGNGIDFGDLTDSNSHGSKGASSSTRGLRMGGYPATNKIDYVEIDTLGNAIDFGDLTGSRYYIGVVSSPIKAVAGGGNVGTTNFPIESVTISSKGNAIDEGDLTVPGGGFNAASNSIRGVWAGGSNSRAKTFIQYRTLATTGTTEHFGDLNFAQRDGAGASTQTRATFIGGVRNTPSSTKINNIEFVTISSTGNAQDFGDLSLPRNSFGGLSDSHGGLGGF